MRRGILSPATATMNVGELAVELLYLSSEIGATDADAAGILRDAANSLDALRLLRLEAPPRFSMAEKSAITALLGWPN